MLQLNKRSVQLPVQLFGLPLKDDGINGNGVDYGDGEVIVMVLIDADGEDRPHVPN